MAFTNVPAGRGMSSGVATAPVSTTMPDLSFERLISNPKDIANFGYNMRQYDPSSALSQQLLTGQMQNQNATNTLGAGTDTLGDPRMDFKTKVGLGLDVAQTGLNAYLGFQGNKLAKKQYNESKRQFNINLGMQRGMIQGQLAENYSRSVNKDRLGTEAEYMARYGMKPATQS